MSLGMFIMFKVTLIYLKKFDPAVNIIINKIDKFVLNSLKVPNNFVSSGTEIVYLT